jgi:hypothetical protein
MEMSPSWETASPVVTQEFPNILWNPKVHYRVHKSLPLSQINPVHNTPSITLKSILIIFTHLRVGLPQSLSFWLSKQINPSMSEVVCNIS